MPSKEVHEIFFSTNVAEIQKAIEAEKRLTIAEQTNSKTSIEESKVKTALINEQIKIKQAKLTKAYTSEIEAERSGNRLKIKEAISTRKVLESELRQFEIAYRGEITKEVKEFETGEQRKRLAMRETINQMKSAPRTFIGSVGSQTELNAIRKTTNQLPIGSEQWLLNQNIISKHVAKQKELEAAIHNSTKRTNEFKKALGDTIGVGLGIGIMTTKIVQFGIESIKLSLKVQQSGMYLKATKEDMIEFKVAAANTITDAELNPMVQYAESLKKTTEETKLAIQQARIMARMGNVDLPTAFNAIVKGEDGYLKSIATLRLSKTQYAKLLEEEVKKIGGTTEAMVDNDGEVQTNIKGLTAQQQQIVRTTAFNKLFTQSFGDVSKAEKTAGEEAATMGVVWENIKEGIGALFIKTYKDLSQAIHGTTMEAGDFARAIEHMKDNMSDLSAVESTYTWLDNFISDMRTGISLALGFETEIRNVRAGLDSKNNDVGDTPGIKPWAQNQEVLEKEKSKKTEEMLGNKKSSGHGKTSKEHVDKIDEANIEIDLLKLKIDLAKEDKTINETILNNAIKQVEVERAALQVKYDSAATDKEKFEIGKDLLTKTQAITSFESDIKNIQAEDEAQWHAIQERENVRKQNILELGNFNKNLDSVLSKNRISLIDNEFDKRKAQILQSYQDEKQKLDELKKEAEEINRKMSGRRELHPGTQKSIDENKKQNESIKQKALSQLEEDKINEEYKKVVETKNAVVSLMTDLGVGTQSFVGTLISGLNTAENIFNDIVKIIGSIMGDSSGGLGFLFSLLDIIPVVGPAISAIAKAAGSNMPSGGGGGNGNNMPSGGGGGNGNNMPSGIDRGVNYHVPPSISSAMRMPSQVTGIINLDGRKMGQMIIPLYNNLQKEITAS